MKSLFAAFLIIATSGCGSADAGDVSREEIERGGKVWPFTVERGRIGCDAGHPWFEANKTRYALNGTARSRYPYVDPVLQVDIAALQMLRAAGDKRPYQPRIDPRDIRDMARAMCRSS